MIHIVLILFMVRDRPITSWTFPIQASSLIATLTTASRTAILVAIASCISQLKWGHFQRPNSLRHMQIYDDASRGPGGSVSMLFRLHFHSVLANSFALLMVLSFLTAKIAKANSYNSTNAAATVGDLPGNFTLSTRFRSAISRPWGSSSFYDVTKTAKSVCSGRASFSSVETCNYTFPQLELMKSRGYSVPLYTKRINIGLNTAVTIISLLVAAVPADGRNALAHMVLLYPVLNQTNGIGRPPHLQVFYANISWCLKTYRNVSSRQGKLSGLDAVETKRLIDSEEGSTLAQRQRRPPDPPERDFGALNIFEINDNDEEYEYETRENGCNSSFLVTRLSDKCQPDRTGLGSVIRNNDPKSLVANVVNTLTNLIVSQDNASRKILAGKAFGKETYVRVCWGWLALPLLEVLGTCILLVVTIISTRGMPLFKDSTLALLLHGLEGWSEDELRAENEQTTEALEEVADRLKAPFMRNENGVLKFLPA
ncbi:hypothetical protein GQ44DRAFT_832702 [Phaeosphaeriaceae sp. PMI808]|nr:hypothetical protein GQ44DRAFT_832702 [Phaeosphaeriaceae sp. PMI808]